MRKICKFSFAVLLSFAILCLGGLFKTTDTGANAAGVVTVYFNAGIGECATTELQTNAEGKLDSLPDATGDDVFFEGWFAEVQKVTKISTDTVFDKSTTLYAGWATKTNSYTITETSGTYTIEGHTTNPTINYTLGSGISTIDDVFTSISAEITDPLTTVSLDFDNITLSSQLVIPYTNFVLSGELDFNVTEPAIKVEPTSVYSLVIFENLSITGSCEKYIDFVTTNLNTEIVFNHCNFLATTSSDYGLFIEDAHYSMTFETYFNHSSTYLFSYTDNLKVYMESELADGSKIVETTIHTHWRDEIVKNFNKANLDNYSLLPLDSFYDIEILTNDSSLRACSYIISNFNLDGGEFADDYTAPTMYYKPELPITLPTADDIVKSHFSFLGWIATVEFTDAEKASYGLSANKYYFNKTQLQALADDSFDYTKLDLLFATTAPATTAEEYFVTYAFDYAGTDINYLPLKLFAELKKEANFLAVYEDIEYYISFVTNTETSADNFVSTFGETITFPTLSKEGHSFAGWFANEELTTSFEATTMPDTNPTLYAKWTPNTYQITLHHNNETTDTSVFNVVFGAEITYPAVSYTGHVLVAYFENESLTTLFDDETMPSRNLELYIKWDLKRVRIHLDSRCAAILDAIIATYGEPIAVPPAPNNPGYEFLGWYTSTAYTTTFDFSVMPEKDTIAYARWIQSTYTITFNSNGGSIISPINKSYGETVQAPGIPVRKGYTFEGWFADEELTETYVFSTMPNTNLTLYAKWTAKKEIIDISTNAQTFTIDDISRDFVAHETLKGFDVKYFVDGAWTSARPQEVGRYNVKIFRAEDDTYAEVNITIKNGYILNNRTLELLWLAITLYILFVIEMVLVIVLRKLRSKKVNDFISLSVVLPFGVISTSQFVMIATGLVLVLFGLILIIYELVKLHRTVPNEDSKPSDFDNSVNIRKIVDKSEDKQIDSKVDELLKTEFAEYDYNKLNESQSNNRPLGSEEPDDITANEDDFDDVFGNPESEDESLNKDDKN